MLLLLLLLRQVGLLQAQGEGVSPQPGAHEHCRVPEHVGGQVLSREQSEQRAHQISGNRLGRLLMKCRWVGRRGGWWWGGRGRWWWRWWRR